MQVLKFSVRRGSLAIDGPVGAVILLCVPVLVGVSEAFQKDASHAALEAHVHLELLGSLALAVHII